MFLISLRNLLTLKYKHSDISFLASIVTHSIIQDVFTAVFKI